MFNVPCIGHSKEKDKQVSEPGKKVRTQTNGSCSVRVNESYKELKVNMNTQNNIFLP
jgi:hypothetical protein